MDSLFITATNTNVGKTYTTIKLIEFFSKQNLSVGVFKPIETGVIDKPLDASLLLTSIKKYNPQFKNLSVNDITSYTFALASAPFCADKEKTIDIDSIIKKYHQLKKRCDILLVEGAGGLFVPISKDFMMIDLIQKLNINTLLVTPSSLGCINATLLSMEALKNRNISFDWCVNKYEDIDTFDEVSKPFYDAKFKDWWSVGEI